MTDTTQQSSSTADIDQTALNDAAWKFIRNAPDDSIPVLLWNNLKAALWPAIAHYISTAVSGPAACWKGWYKEYTCHCPACVPAELSQFDIELLAQKFPLPETRYNGCGDGSEPLYTPEMVYAYAHQHIVAMAHARAPEVNKALEHIAKLEKQIKDASRQSAPIEAGELPPEAGTLHDDGYFTWKGPTWPHEANKAGWRAKFYTEDQIRGYGAAERKQVLAEADIIHKDLIKTTNGAGDQKKALPVIPQPRPERRS